MSSINENATTALDTLKDYLKAKDWKVRKMEDEFRLVSQKNGEFYPIKYYFQIIPEKEEFLFYIVPEINLFEHMLPAASEYICRANFGLRIGNFELDFSDGQVTFKSSVKFKGTKLSRALINGAIEPALTAFDEFFPGLKNVIMEIETPVEAIAKAHYGDSPGPLGRMRGASRSTRGTAIGSPTNETDE